MANVKAEAPRPSASLVVVNPRNEVLLVPSQKKQIPDMGFQRGKLIQALSQRCDASRAATGKVSSDRRLQYHIIVAAPVSDWPYSSSNFFILHRT